jgi:exosortase A
MNAPLMDEALLADAPATATGPDWRCVALPLALGLLLLGALFNREVVVAVQTWNASTAYNHCFLIIPIVFYLLWDRRFDLVGLKARPMPVAVLLGLPLMAAWLVAERLGIMEGRQLVAVSFVEVLFLGVLGKRLWWAMAGPLLYLFFLVPFGEFLTPQLQDVTTWFIRHGVDMAGIPAYIDGYIIEIPQGTFFVAEACAGLRFLIASIAFGCLYALIMYRSPWRRGLFILVSIIVPIIANGFRGFGIVYLGWVLGSAQAAAADHIIYGWMFFSLVILLLIALGLPFREDEQPTRSATPPDASIRFPLRTALGIAAVTVIMAAISPTVAGALTMATAVGTSVPDFIDAGPGCTVRVMAPQAANLRSERVVCGGVPMDVSWAAFSPRITAAPLMAERRRLATRAETEGLQESWLEASNGIPSAWRIMHSTDPQYMIAVAMWVDGKPARPGLVLRGRMAMNSLFGSSFAPMVVTVTPAVDWDALSAEQTNSTIAALPAFLLRNPKLDTTIGELTRR